MSRQSPLFPLVTFGLVAILAGPSASAQLPVPLPPIPLPLPIGTAPPSSSPTVAGCGAGMASIPGGKYVTGHTKSSATVAAFCLDLMEVTVKDYTTCVTAGTCTAPNPYVAKTGLTDQFCNWKHPSGRSSHPQNCVDWNQATAYCASQNSRLPTEEEWEWAARSGEKGYAHPWGNDKPTASRVNACGSECWPAFKKKSGLPDIYPDQMMYKEDDGYPETAPVGSFPKGNNAWGVHDLDGNVSEWTSSPKDSSGKDPAKVVRGGSWGGTDENFASITFRQSANPGHRSYEVGFRCAKTLGTGTATVPPADLAKSKKCMVCHAVGSKVVGPAYKDVAAKYAGQKDAEAKLVQKVMKGSAGAWSAVPMPANTHVSDEDAKTLVKWVLAQK